MDWADVWDDFAADIPWVDGVVERLSALGVRQATLDRFDAAYRRRAIEFMRGQNNIARDFASVMEQAIEQWIVPVDGTSARTVNAASMPVHAAGAVTGRADGIDGTDAMMTTTTTDGADATTTTTTTADVTDVMMTTTTTSAPTPTAAPCASSIGASTPSDATAVPPSAGASAMTTTTTQGPPASGLASVRAPPWAMHMATPFVGTIFPSPALPGLARGAPHHTPFHPASLAFVGTERDPVGSAANELARGALESYIARGRGGIPRRRPQARGAMGSRGGF